MLIVYNLLRVDPNKTPSLGRKANDSIPVTLRVATLVIAPLVLLNVTKAAEFDMPYNVPFVGQQAMSFTSAPPMEEILLKLPFSKLMVPKRLVD